MSEEKAKLPIEDKIDGRRNNGGHKTAGAKKRDIMDKCITIEVRLTPNAFKKKTWKSSVLDQFQVRFENRLTKLKIN